MRRYTYINSIPYRYKKGGNVYVQKYYDTLYNDVYMNTCDDVDIKYLHTLYMHSMMTGKWYILQHDVDSRLMKRIKTYIDVMKSMNIRMRYSNDIDVYKKCSIKQSDDRHTVRRYILDMYNDIHTNVLYEGGMRVYGVDINRDNNRSFIDYNVRYSDDILTYSLIDNNKDKETMDSIMKDMGMSIEKEEKAKRDERYIVVSQYRIDSNMYIQYMIDNEWIGVSDHSMRIEKYVHKDDSNDKICLYHPILCDYDMYLCGNPHPNMYI